MRGAPVSCFAAALFISVSLADEQQPKPLSLHPDNPHYFLFRGKPAMLITSGEHYGAVLNKDFDYIPYLDELQKHNFNLTRTFAGTYREYPGAFNIKENTLAPGAKSFLSPWPRTSIPGASDGLNKFDLNSFDPAYFDRLKNFLTEAARRGIIVEVVFFCTMYDEKLWAISPMNNANNINNIGRVGPYEVYSLKEKPLTTIQQNLVRKIVTELKDFDNLYYEICNEPYERGGLTKKWNDAIVAAIVEAERDFPHKHLIAQGINRKERITDPNPAVSIFNFHAASPDDAARNHSLNKPLADDETGGKGQDDFAYRSEAWEFLLAGGSVFSHLDFSFTPADPRGSAQSKQKDVPGGGGPELRKQISILKTFLEGFDFLKMRPDDPANSILHDLPKSTTARALIKPGRAYVIYLRGGTQATFTIDLPAARYQLDWLNPKTGRIDKTESLTHPGRRATLTSPPYTQDIALRITAQ